MGPADELLAVIETQIRQLTADYSEKRDRLSYFGYSEKTQKRAWAEFCESKRPLEETREYIFRQKAKIAAMLRPAPIFVPVTQISALPTPPTQGVQEPQI